MKINKWLKFWYWLNNYKYILNTKTHELHTIKDIKRQCGVQYMNKKNKMLLSEHSLFLMLRKGYKIDGCTHCNKIMNTD